MTEKSRKLSMQSLENREMMAGDIQAYVSNGDLIIRGDDADNGVLVSEVADGEYAVIGLDHGDNPTLVNNANEVRFSGVTDDVDIRLGEGDDKLEIDNSRQTDMDYYPEAGAMPAYSGIPDDLRIHMQGGNDEVKIAVTDVGDDLYLYTQAGADSVRLDHVITGDALLISTAARTGDGADQVEVRGLHVGGRLGVWTGDGADTIDVRGQNTVLGDMTVYADEGNDQVNLMDESVWYRHLRTYGDLSVQTGGGDDSVFLRDVEGRENVTVATGEGRDVVTIYESTVGYDRDLYGGDHMHTGSLTIDTGNDRDSVNLYDNNVANDVSVDLGQGDNLAWIGNTTAGVPSNNDDDPQAANISVSSGSGRDQVSIIRSEATDTIMADLGAGNDGLGVEFSKAEMGHFDLGLGSDQYQLWQNDFDEQQVLNPLYPIIVVPIVWP